jgi:hypothetical protein
LTTTFSPSDRKLVTIDIFSDVVYFDNIPAFFPAHGSTSDFCSDNFLSGPESRLSLLSSAASFDSGSISSIAKAVKGSTPSRAMLNGSRMTEGVDTGVVLPVLGCDPKMRRGTLSVTKAVFNGWSWVLTPTSSVVFGAKQSFVDVFHSILKLLDIVSAYFYSFIESCPEKG